jgi:hypothetical protein
MSTLTPRIDIGYFEPGSPARHRVAVCSHHGSIGLLALDHAGADALPAGGAVGVLDLDLAVVLGPDGQRHHPLRGVGRQDALVEDGRCRGRGGLRLSLGELVLRNGAAEDLTQLLRGQCRGGAPDAVVGLLHFDVGVALLGPDLVAGHLAPDLGLVEPAPPVVVGRSGFAIVEVLVEQRDRLLVEGRRPHLVLEVIRGVVDDEAAMLGGELPDQPGTDLAPGVGAVLLVDPVDDVVEVLVEAGPHFCVGVVVVGRNVLCPRHHGAAEDERRSGAGAGLADLASGGRLAGAAAQGLLHLLRGAGTVARHHCGRRAPVSLSLGRVAHGVPHPFPPGVGTHQPEA